jgi:DNA-binding NtrC family response regulator
MVARSLHYHGWRAGFPFLLVDSRQLPDEYLHPLLFGRVDVAHTGEWRVQRGVIEVMGSGTLYINEASQLSPEVQQKLVELIVDRKFRRLGELGAHESTARVALGSTLESNQLSARLLPEFARLLKPTTLRVEPLRERVEDIPHLVSAFIKESVRTYGKEMVEVTNQALAALTKYSWPGNVSELKSVIGVAVKRIKPQPFDETVLPEHIAGTYDLIPPVQLSEEGADFYELTGRYEQALVEAALRITRGNQRRASQLLKLKETTLAAMLKRIRLSTGKKARKLRPTSSL